MRIYFFTLLLFLTASAISAGIICVPADCPTIQSGIDSALSNDTVMVAPGVYEGLGNYNISFGKKELLLMSQSGAHNTIIDCGGDEGFTRRAFYINNSSNPVTIDGFTICGVFGTAACTFSYAAVTLKHCLIRNNQDANDAPISCNSSDVTIENCTIANNSGGAGCAIHYISSSQLVISNSIIGFNDGDIPITQEFALSSPVISNTDIYGNTQGDWVGCIADLADSSGNMSIDPFFCDAISNDYHLLEISRCQPDSNINGLIGALNVGCINGSYPFASIITVEPVDSVGVVGSPFPCIYWRYEDSVESDQIAFQIEIRDDPYWFTPSLWSSGEIYTDDSFFVYNGFALERNSEYIVRLRLANAEGWGPWRDKPVYAFYNKVIKIPDSQLTIQDGIDAAIDGDTIQLADGIFTGDGNGNIKFYGKKITLTSENGPQSSILMGYYELPTGVRALELDYEEDSLSIIDGITFAEWNTFDHTCGGSAIYCSGSSPTIRNCLFLNNRTASHVDPAGGAIYCINSNPIIVNCTFVENLAYYGSAIYGHSSAPKINNCIFANNLKSDPIAIDGMSIDSSVWGTVQYCDFFGNDTGSYSSFQFILTDSVCENPLFCDIDADNYMLSDNSSCLPENNDFNSLIGALGSGCHITDITDNNDISLPKRFYLGQNMPNPFNISTVIPFSVSRKTRVSISIYDLLGRKINTLLDKILSPGEYSVAWNGVDRNGSPVATGVYFYRFESPDLSTSRKLILLK